MNGFHRAIKSLQQFIINEGYDTIIIYYKLLAI